LLDAGLLERTDDGRVVFPYDAVRVEFDLLTATEPGLPQGNT
jgi:hypothetical protein